MASVASFPTRPLSTNAGRHSRDTRAEQPQPGLLARIAAAVLSMRQRRTEASVGRFIERNGGKVTDSLEREIERRFMTF